jgi:hypothetical protein
MLVGDLEGDLSQFLDGHLVNGFFFLVMLLLGMVFPFVEIS